ncbi:hypothetical protein BH10PSE19_BH10PSE19_14760 [soil metagenome]
MKILLYFLFFTGILISTNSIALQTSGYLNKEAISTVNEPINRLTQYPIKITIPKSTKEHSCGGPGGKITLTMLDNDGLGAQCKLVVDAELEKGSLKEYAAALESSQVEILGSARNPISFKVINSNWCPDVYLTINKKCSPLY